MAVVGKYPQLGKFDVESSLIDHHSSSDDFDLDAELEVEPVPGRDNPQLNIWRLIEANATYTAGLFHTAQVV